MKMGRRRKSSSPEPQDVPSKVVRKNFVCGSHGGYRQTLSPGKRISTPTKRKAPDLSPRANSLRLKFHGPTRGYSERGNDCVQSSSLHSEEDTELGLVITLDEERGEKQKEPMRKNGGKPKRAIITSSDAALSAKEKGHVGASEEEDCEEEFRKLDRDLAMKSKQHNLTSVNVRNIIHEVITNEHVVAMMKAAIIATQDMPMFEPKMTRSKLKEVVEKGVGIPNWNLSPIKKSNEIKPPQFVDIPLEDEEDSSDEEYHPDEDEEDETGEETILESDMDSIASSPRISRRGRSLTPIELSEYDEERSNSPCPKPRPLRHLRVEAVPMGPPAPPSQFCGSSRPLKALDSFMEKLHAVDEELELNPLCMEPYQTLSSSDSLVACRTRSKRPLRDIPLDQLEAELCAPDITPDMYDCVSALEDRVWSQWLQGLMTSHLDNEEEADDDDDPEYNFLDDLDEPDLEDYRNDRAVRITKKEVNELMEELFETFQDELGVNEHNEEGHEEGEEQDEENLTQSTAKFNVPQAIRFEEPLANMLTACRRTVREQLDMLQQRREQESQQNQSTPGPTMVLIPPPCMLVVTPSQKHQLQQQIQQHIQLLTQVNMLCSPVEALQSQATTTKLFLMELQSFAERAEQLRASIDPGFQSLFRVCNLQPSLNLLEEVKHTPCPRIPSTKAAQSHSAHHYPLLPAHLAWLFATRSVFIYPELLPHCSLDPALQSPRSKNLYTKGEDGLIVLGLKHFSETEFPYHLMCQYLISPKKLEQLRVRVKDMCSSRASDNVIKFYCKHHVVPPLPVACCPVVSGEARPPVEREKNIMPSWLQKSLPNIHKAVFESQSEERTPSDNRTTNASPPLVFPEKTNYPKSLPEGLTLLLHPSAKRQTSARKPKPRPLHGFAQPARTPLAKAPPCASGTINLLPNVPAPLPSQGVILLTQTPYIPVNGALPVNQVASTPAHGTVPLNSVGPVNFQYVVPQLGCVNPVEPPASLPPAVVQNPSTPVFTTCAIQSVPKKVEMPKKRIMPRKLLPVQPTLTPADQLSRLIPLTPGSAVSMNLGATATVVEPATVANCTEKITKTPPSMVIIQPSSLLDNAAVHFQVTPQGWVKSSNSVPRQDPTTQPDSSLSHLGTLARPLLPGNSGRIPSPDCPNQPPESKFKLKSSPQFVSHTPSPPLQAVENLKSRHAMLNVDQQSWHGPALHKIKGERISNRPVTDYHSVPLLNTLDNNKNTTNLISTSLSPQKSSAEAAPLANSVHNLFSFTSLPADHSQYVLVQAASQGGTPQFLLVPQTNQKIPNQPESRVPQQHSLPFRFETLHNSKRDNLSLNVGEPSKGSTVQVTASVCTDGGGGGAVWKEEMEVGAEMGGEEMAGALFGSPFLTLSESSCSPDSSLSSSNIDSSTEASESTMQDTMPSPSVEQQRDREELSSYSKEKGKKKICEGIHTSVAVKPGQVSRKQKIPGLLAFTSGTEKEDTSGGADGQSEGNRRDEEEGEGQQNGESGGGDGRDGDEEGNKGGEGDGGRGRQGNEGGDKNDDEKEGDGDREEEEEDFDELTQDEDEEEVMSSASEESVLSVPELQETMEKLTWLASERRLCGEGDSEEDNSPNSPTSPTSPTSPISQNSQEENSEDEEECTMKELETTEGEGGKLPEGDIPQEDDPPQTSGKGAGRGRGRGRPPPRSLKRSRRQERGSKDTSKLLLLYDDHILDNDPLRESKDTAYAQAYLERVREVMQDTPGKMEEFLSLLYEFEQGGDSRSAVELFSQLKPLLKDWPELLSDFAAFLHPEQALECGLFEEQQAFERSRRFLRQLEISFGENPTHYQKIVRALQAGTALTPAGIEELKVQMATLLKGHTHLQGEFSLFFDELRPPPARPGQFEEALWPEDAGSGLETGDGGVGLGSAGGMSGGFEEVTLPDLEEEEETHKIPQITSKSRRRKELGTHRKYKDCDWPEKDCPCPCHCQDTSHEAKHRRHKRKGCPRCHSNKGTEGSKALKRGDASFSTVDAKPEQGEEREVPERRLEEKEEEKETETMVKDESGSGANSPHHEPEGQAWEGSDGDPPPNPVERDDEEVHEEEEGKRGQCSSPNNPNKDEEGTETEPSEHPPLLQSGDRDMTQQSRQSPSSDMPVCAKNISLTPSGERVVLWTREADRVILTACQQQGASQSTFQAVSAQLGNKTASEVSKRFRDLMRLFHTSARQASSEDEGTEQQSATDEEQD